MKLYIVAWEQEWQYNPTLYYANTPEEKLPEKPEERGKAFTLYEKAVEYIETLKPYWKNVESTGWKIYEVELDTL
jgi:hypothetical protein